MSEGIESPKTEESAVSRVDIDTGDHVLHRPTGERWLVACVIGDRLSWCGWPEGMANLKDCDLVRKATPSERDALIERMAMIGSNDHRARYAQATLSTPAKVEGRGEAGKEI